jgi:hypothetical protein
MESNWNFRKTRNRKRNRSWWSTLISKQTNQNQTNQKTPILLSIMGVFVYNEISKSKIVARA